MLWNPGKSDVEIFVNSALLLTFILLQLGRKIIDRKLGKDSAAKSSSSEAPASDAAQSQAKLETLEAEIGLEERQLEALCGPETFVEYAKAQRKLNVKRKELEALKKGRETQASPAAGLEALGLDNKSNLADKILRSRVVLCIFVYIASYFLPSEVQPLLTWRKIATTSFVASMAFDQLLSGFDVKKLKNILWSRSIAADADRAKTS